MTAPRVNEVRTSILASFVLGAVVTGQVARSPEVPLRNWPAPLYWQPSLSLTEAGGMRAENRTASPHATTSSPIVFVAMTPCRVVDTRAGQMFPSPFGAPSLSTGPARIFPIQSSTLCSIPSNAQAYSFNVTVIPPGGLGYLILWPTGQSQPNAVTLDDITGDIRNNAAIIPAGTPNGSISAVVNATTDLVIDINGYYAPDLGNGNTAIGLNALVSNTTGSNNTANGSGALNSNTTGNNNSASGAFTLDKNTAGHDNTASGYVALANNTTGNYNTASGATALYSNTTGSSNTASGDGALFGNTTGHDNVAAGNIALASNIGGSYNTTSGSNALFSNTTGNYNTASGFIALSGNTTGSNNAAFGYSAGNNITTGSNNIDIGNAGLPSDGTAMNSGVIRIGAAGSQTSFFAAGIIGAMTGGMGTGVLVDGNGQLGTIQSSRRYKQDIEDMADASSGLFRLRPVTFRYKKTYADGSQPMDYGLVAEEVAQVYPDLVVKGADGQIETVQYHKLTPMLLNELQKERESVSSLQAQVSALQKALETLMAGQVQPPRPIVLK